jgi:hypothetical protein
MSELTVLAFILYHDGMDFTAIGNFLFYFIGIFTTFYLIIFANKWKRLMVLWEKHEDVFSSPPYSHLNESILFARKVKFLCGFFIGFLIGKFLLGFVMVPWVKMK